MKNAFLAVLFCCLFSAPIWGQVLDDVGNSPAQARVQAARVAYITDRLGLTPEESEQFWAIQNEFETKQSNIRKKYNPTREVESMSDQEAEAFILNRFKMEEELLALKKEYFPKFKTIISARKVALYTKADREFRKQILTKIRQQRRGKQGFQRN